MDFVRYIHQFDIGSGARGDLGSLPCTLHDNFPNPRKKTYVKDGPRSSFRLSSSLLGSCHLLPQHPSNQAGPRRALWHHGPTEEDSDAGMRIGKRSGTSYLDLRDSYVPVFSGQPSDYREWRQRIHLYHRKMSITKRGNESVLNIVGSFTGLTWQLFQDWALEDLEKTDAFPKIIEVLDCNFAYDARVQLPADFESYFNLLQRQGGQTLLMFINDHEEAYRKLQQHKVELPASVQGWHLFRRAGLSREQHQLITLKAPTMEKNEVIEALYLIPGQDYKGGGWNVERNRRFGIQSHSWKHRAYVADDYDEENYQDDEQWEHGYYEEDENWLEEAPDYEAYDEGQDFDYDAGYYGEEEPWPDNESFPNGRCL